VASTSLGACNGGAWGGGCGSTNECCDSGRKGLFSRLGHKNRNNDCGCAPAPVQNCCAPVHHQPTADCGCEQRHGLCAKIKARFNRDRGCGCDSGCGSTNGYGYGAAAPWGGAGAPAEAIPAQPKPGEAPRRMPGTGGGTPMTINGIIRDVTPVVAPRLSIEQPF
jgi:hypothetical protein